MGLLGPVGQKCFRQMPLLSTRSWSFKCGTGPYIKLMDEYPKVTEVFLELDAPFQQVPPGVFVRQSSPEPRSGFTLPSAETCSTDYKRRAVLSYRNPDPLRPRSLCIAANVSLAHFAQHLALTRVISLQTRSVDPLLDGSARYQAPSDARLRMRRSWVSSLPQVITDITRRMGEGMAEFISKEVATVADYDRSASAVRSPVMNDGCVRLAFRPSVHSTCTEVRVLVRVRPNIRGRAQLCCQANGR